jgi:hypothetical protein
LRCIKGDQCLVCDDEGIILEIPYGMTGLQLIEAAIGPGAQASAIIAVDGENMVVYDVPPPETIFDGWSWRPVHEHFTGKLAVLVRSLQ